MVRKQAAETQIIEAGVTMPVMLPGLRRPEAAAYIGVSEEMFRQWVAIGIMPKPIKPPGSAISLWDLVDLNRYFNRLKEDDENRPNDFD